MMGNFQIYLKNVKNVPILNFLISNVKQMAIIIL